MPGIYMYIVSRFFFAFLHIAFLIRGKFTQNVHYYIGIIWICGKFNEQSFEKR